MELTLNLTHYEVKQLLFALNSNILELKKWNKHDANIVFEMMIEERYQLADKIEHMTNVKTFGEQSIDTTQG